MASHISRFGKLKLIILASLAIAAGAFLLKGGLLTTTGPDGVVTQSDQNFGLGAGLIGFGLLMLIALVSVRATALAMMFGLAAFSGLLLSKALAGDLSTWETALFYGLGVLGALAALGCFFAALRGKDPIRRSA